MTPLIWLAAGLAVCCAEAVVPGVYLIWLGLAAVATGLLLLVAAVPLPGQVAVFAGLAALSVLAGRVWTRRQHLMDPNAVGAELVGQPCRAIAFDGVEGRVRFRDSDWAARSTSAPITAGEPMQIVGLNGAQLLVARIGDDTGAP